MKTVEQTWLEFGNAIFQPGTSVLQIKEMRRAFYAGFYAALMAGIEMADETGDDDDAGIAAIERLHKECREFGAAVADGRA